MESLFFRLKILFYWKIIVVEVTETLLKKERAIMALECFWWGVISRSFAGFMQWHTLAGTLLMLLWPVLENKIGQHTSTTERVQLECVLT